MIRKKYNGLNLRYIRYAMQNHTTNSDSLIYYLTPINNDYLHYICQRCTAIIIFSSSKTTDRGSSLPSMCSPQQQISPQNQYSINSPDVIGNGSINSSKPTKRSKIYR